MCFGTIRVTDETLQLKPRNLIRDPSNWRLNLPSLAAHRLQHACLQQCGSLRGVVTVVVMVMSVFSFKYKIK